MLTGRQVEYHANVSFSILPIKAQHPTPPACTAVHNAYYYVEHSFLSIPKVEFRSTNHESDLFKCCNSMVHAPVLTDDPLILRNQILTASFIHILYKRALPDEPLANLPHEWKSTER
jgi:hypothetical protein